MIHNTNGHVKLITFLTYIVTKDPFFCTCFTLQHNLYAHVHMYMYKHIINVSVLYNHIVTRGEDRGHTDTRIFHVLDLIMLIGFQRFVIGKPPQ